MPIKKALGFLATACLLSAQTVPMPPGAGFEELEQPCTHPTRVWSQFQNSPCPAFYNCHAGHKHRCEYPTNGAGRRCTTCNDYANINYRTPCPLAAQGHPNRPCPGIPQ
ncbi:hypothetical protein PGT21_023902 [Puccinia graminis f. sp. tritici]|uniref:Chitin-binding type-2 domain-containing protein n=2 Tax=Puccinia graminis f. sp. tritici TaxID=56615 RepID=E3KXW0_PUCGT|nr:uncharacterized protein PGTG_14887 [Puccinia graminis f. sp. tritici CRL 75-36-700-3]EFP89046.1 hypothetical protein PGTG_14887 [Puccinia graminis f. sp. tritici CRL 75-36-700-3]KAA1066052.1 hypothetical protein PGT21_019337 [Puccinia graminis f. sp. tritici]KAA1087159.1 hypothetical protein PGT21_023902 [Puccinia graminis f. sp. tritici]